MIDVHRPGHIYSLFDTTKIQLLKYPSLQSTLFNAHQRQGEQPRQTCRGSVTRCTSYGPGVRHRWILGP